MKLSAGIDKTFLDKTFNHKDIKVHSKIKELFEKPYEKERVGQNIEKYSVTKKRWTLEQNSTLANTICYSTSTSMNIDPLLILSIIGVETNYGTQRGNYNVFNALYTQIKIMPESAQDGQRELISFLKYCL